MYVPSSFALQLFCFITWYLESVPLPLHAHCSCTAVPLSYPVRFYDLELSLLAFGDETKVHVTVLFLDLSENKMGGNSTE